MSKRNWELFERVLEHTRAYFVLQNPAGTREMVYRYVISKLGGDVSYLMVSAALRILKERNAIIYDKKVWWFLGDH